MTHPVHESDENDRPICGDDSSDPYVTADRVLVTCLACRVAAETPASPPAQPEPPMPTEGEAIEQWRAAHLCFACSHVPVCKYAPTDARLRIVVSSCSLFEPPPQPPEPT